LGRLSKYKFIFLLLAFSGLGYGQKQNLGVIPQEEIIISTNSDLFVVGETIFYKLHCFNLETRNASSISKIAYVSLISDKKEVVFTQKLNLDKGLANGDYYIPPSVSTGNYKLVSYTKWMNNRDEPVFELDVYIINPFYQTLDHNSNGPSNRIYSDSIAFSKSFKTQLINSANKIRLITDQNSYKTRSKVSLEIPELRNTFRNGHYSISVRKLDPIIITKESKEPQKSGARPETLHLPEIRGEIISGSIRSIEDNKGVPNKIVGLSITGNANIYKNVRSDRHGKFYFNLYENYEEGNLIIQLIDTERDDYKIILDDRSLKNINKLSFSKLYLNPNIENWLLQKSINNQVESAFFSIKTDSILRKEEPRVFYGNSGEEFLLDDYTRFPTIKETFVEIIKGAGTRNVKGNRKIVIINSEIEQNNLLPDLETLVLIDGIPILDHDIVLDFSSKEIEKISIIKSLYYHGPSMYNGIIALETKEGNFSLP